MIEIMDGLTVSEAMKKYNKKIEEGYINLINANAGSGKNYFTFNELINNTYLYIENNTIPLKLRLNKILYVCDTSMLAEATLSDNDLISESLKSGGLIEAKEELTLKRMINENCGTIKVITYNKLGMLLKNEKCRYIIANDIDLIILDEIHNLFKYAYRYNFDVDKNKYNENGNYITVIAYLKSLSYATTVLALTATPSSLYDFTHINKFDIGNVRHIFDSRELKTIKSYNFKPIYTNCIMNNLKRLAWQYEKMKRLNYKIFIYTNTIRKSIEYKEWFEKHNMKAEWLCSINNKQKIINVNENGKEVIEKIPTMNEYQLEIRNRLLNGDNKGTLPDDLDVLIVNSGYETGWNLLDERVQLCFIDDSNEDTHIQARNRIRHDIVTFVVKANIYDAEGRVLIKEQYGNLVEKQMPCDGGYITPIIKDNLCKSIDEKYIGVKLNKELKDELVYNYGIKHLEKDNKVNFTNLKKDLVKMGYVVKIYKGKNSGTYIFNKGQEIKKDSIKEIKKMDELNIVCDWLLSRWDRVRIDCKSVMDALDIGKKTWNKVINSNEFELFLKENRIKIKKVKGLGNTLYFTTY